MTFAPLPEERKTLTSQLASWSALALLLVSSGTHSLWIQTWIHTHHTPNTSCCCRRSSRLLAHVQFDLWLVLLSRAHHCWLVYDLLLQKPIHCLVTNSLSLAVPGLFVTLSVLERNVTLGKWPCSWQCAGLISICTVSHSTGLLILASSPCYRNETQHFRFFDRRFGFLTSLPIRVGEIILILTTPFTRLSLYL